jgi:hypothetical protein
MRKETYECYVVTEIKRYVRVQARNENDAQEAARLRELCLEEDFKHHGYCFGDIDVVTTEKIDRPRFEMVN